MNRNGPVSEILNMITMLPRCLISFHDIQLAHVVMRLTPEQQYSVRRRHRTLVRECLDNVTYKYILPNTHEDGPVIVMDINDVCKKYTYRINGVVHGVWISYNELNKLYERFAYRNGVAHGERVVKYINGTIDCAQYVDGQLQGEYKSWYASKTKTLRLRSQCTFVDNEAQGPFLNWYESGGLHERYMHVNSIASGDHTIYYESGALYFRTTLVDGISHGLHTVWYESGGMRAQYYRARSDDAFSGEYLSWYESGQLRKQCSYVNNRLYGEYKHWTVDGTLDRHCMYIDGDIERDLLVIPCGQI